MSSHFQQHLQSLDFADAFNYLGTSIQGLLAGLLLLPGWVLFGLFGLDRPAGVIWFFGFDLVVLLAWHWAEKSPRVKRSHLQAILSLVSQLSPLLVLELASDPGTRQYAYWATSAGIGSAILLAAVNELLKKRKQAVTP